MQYYYVKSLEKVTSGLLNMFNDVTVSQYQYDKIASSWERSYYRVPIAVATKDKMLREFEQNQHSSGPKRYPNVPRMALALNGVDRFSGKQTNQMGIIKSGTEFEGPAGRKLMQYIRNPAWYRASYTLSVLAKRMDDMAQIVEQICPMFIPQRSLNVKIIPELGISVSLEVTMNGGIRFDMPDEVNFDQLRMVSCDLELTVPVPMFPPVSDYAVITHILSRFAPVRDFSDLRMSQAEEFEEFNRYGSRTNTTPMRLTAIASGKWTVVRSCRTIPIKMSALVSESS